MVTHAVWRIDTELKPRLIPMRPFSTMFNQIPWPVSLFVAVVFGSLLFGLPSVAQYHGDESFYTDAAIRMMQTGDYLTPYAANGALRFANPILPYWAVAAGYFVFGINFFASRLLFLIAGCLVILFTYRLSLDLFGRPAEAVLAALIIGSNVHLLSISIRSTPEVLLGLFALLSLFGFARLIFQNDRSWKNYIFAYLGAGLAIETCAPLGFGVILFPLLFCLLFRRKQTRMRQLLEWKAILLGLLLAFSWFGLMLWLHGRALIDGFYYDQVTDNARDYQFLDTLKNLRANLTGLPWHFLPWSALLVLGLVLDRKIAVEFWREHRAKALFLVGWFLLILVPCVLSRDLQTLYLTVAYPMLAVLVAGFLSRYATLEPFDRWMARLVGWAALVLGTGGLVLAGAGALVHPRVLVAGLLLVVAGGVVWLIMRRGIQWGYWLAIAGISLVGFWAAQLLLRPLFSSSPAAALTAKLLPDPLMKARVYGLNMSPAYQAQMRVLSGGRLTVAPLVMDSLTEFPQGYEAWVFSENEKPLVAHQAGRLEQVGFASGQWQVGDFADLLHSSQRAAAFARNRIAYYVLFPESAGTR
jgi:4-amino-4-deoxy-L-arabinose transferase-like glycosyltransferase